LSIGRKIEMARKRRNKPRYNRKATLLERAISWRRESGGINGYYKAHQKFCKEQLRILKRNEKGDWKIKHQILAELLTLEGALACAIDRRHEAITAADHGIKSAKGIKKLRRQSFSWFSRVVSRLKDPNQLRITLESDKSRLGGVETLDLKNQDHTWLMYRNLLLAHIQNYMNVEGLEKKVIGSSFSTQCMTSCLHYLTAMGPKPLFSSSEGIVPDLDETGYSLMLTSLEVARAIQENDESIDFDYIEKLNKSSIEISDSNCPTEALRFLYNNWSSGTTLIDLPNLNTIVNLFKNKDRTNSSIFSAWHLSYYEHKEMLAEDAEAKKKIRKCQLRLNRPYLDLINMIDEVRSELTDSLANHQKQSKERLDSITYTSQNIEKAKLHRQWNTWLCEKEYELECERLLILGLIILSHCGVDIENGSYKSITKLPSKWLLHYKALVARTENLFKMTAVEEDSDLDEDIESTTVSNALLINLMGGEMIRDKIEVIYEKVSPFLKELEGIMSTSTDNDERNKNVDIRKLSQSFTLDKTNGGDRLCQILSIFKACAVGIQCDDEKLLEQQNVDASIIEEVTATEQVIEETHAVNIEVKEPESAREYLEEEEDIFDSNDRKAVDSGDEGTKGTGYLSSLKRAFWG